MNFLYKNTFPFGDRGSEERQKYREEGNRLYLQFKQDLFEELGIENNPKKEVLFGLAWERGHSSGYSEVYNEALELVVLIED